MKFLFDLGGVFFDWDPRYFFKDIFTDHNELNFFLSEVCNGEWNVLQDAGRSIKDAEKEKINKFPKYEKQIKMYYPNHRKMIKSVFSESVNALEVLIKSNFECYVLSNWSSETFKGMTEDYPFLNKFDGMIISGNDKLIKPDLAIYKLAISRFNIKTKNTVFIDDRLDNIKAAEKLQFKTIHLLDPKNIKVHIDHYLI